MFGDGILPGPSKVNPSLVDLMQLNYLDLSRNNFSGRPIPEFIGSLVKLEYLNLSQASFGGTIPSQIGNLSNLRFLDLSGSFSSFGPDFTVPSLSVGDNLDWLSHFPFLEYLDMTRVNFSKVSGHWIPQVNMLPSLSVLILSDVGLDVGISTNLDHLNFTSLTVLDLSQNQFKTIPNWLFNLSSLVHLNLEACGLQPNAQFFDTLVTSLRQLRFLDLDSNNIRGNIPEAFGNLTQLQILYLGGNHLGGAIPETIGNLVHLLEYDLQQNMITGELPNTIGNMIKLQHLNLYGNQISGELPQTIYNLDNLQELTLDNNNFSGELPENIQKLHNLQVLSMKNNSIGGQLPTAAIGSLCKLQVLDLSYNTVGGEITALIDGLSQCTQNMNYSRERDQSGLTFLDLSQNKFLLRLDPTHCSNRCTCKITVLPERFPGL